jgi:membrane protease YdiL (CAAX protease family)
MFGLNILLGGVLSALKWSFFLPSTQNTKNIAALVNNPLALLLIGVVAAPLWEELVFRGCRRGYCALSG